MNSNFSWRSCNVRMFSIISFPRNFKIHPSPPEISACIGFFLYSFAKVYFHIFTYVRYLHIFSPELYFFIIIFAHLFQDSKSPRRPPGLIASFCGARHGCAPSPRGPVVKQIRYSYLSFFKVFWDKCGCCACLLEGFVSVSRKHETTIWQGPSFPGPWKWSSINPSPFPAER